MDANEIVMHEIDRHLRVVLRFLGKGVRQPRHAAVAHPDIQILALNIGR
jgi:hypothetical protein